MSTIDCFLEEKFFLFAKSLFTPYDGLMKYRRTLSFIPILLLSLLASCAGSPEPVISERSVSAVPDKVMVPKETSYRETLDELLIEMEQIITASGEQLLLDIWNVTKEKRSDGVLIFDIGESFDDLSTNRLGQAAFNFSSRENDPVQYIKLEEKLFRFSPDNRSLIMAVIVHELCHAYSFYTDWDSFTGNKKILHERYLYEMDALFAEALFARACRSEGYASKRFEDFLVRSLEENNMALVSLTLKGVNNGMVWDFMEDYEAIAEEKAEWGKYLDGILDLAGSLKADWENRESGDDWNDYMILINLTTFDQYLPSIINPLIDDEVLYTWEEQIRELNAYKADFVTILEDNKGIIDEYLSGFYDWLYEDL